MGMPDNKSTAKTPRASHTPIPSSIPQIDHRVITDKVYSLVKQAFRASYSDAYPSQTQKSLISQCLETNEYNPNTSRQYQPRSSRLLNSSSDFINNPQSSSFSGARFPSVHSGSLNNSLEYGPPPMAKLSSDPNQTVILTRVNAEFIDDNPFFSKDNL
jgi:hypothetical protein